MKTLLFPGFILLLLASPLHAGTYSWLDDSGTYNFTEDYSKVPRKYQKKVMRREDLPPDDKPQLSPDQGVVLKQDDKAGVKPAAGAGGEAELYGGKSRAEWRKEMETLEAELSAIEQHLEQVRKQINDAKVLSKAQFDLLKKEYDDGRAGYGRKYESYKELIEAVRKAGIPVEIRK